MESAVYTMLLLCGFACSSVIAATDVGNSSRPHKANNSDGTDLSGTTHTKTKITKFSSFTVIRRCCINDNCHILKEGEKCGEFKNVEIDQDNAQNLKLNDIWDKIAKNKLQLNRSNAASNDFNEKIIKQIRYEVLQKSNFYRQKFGIASLTLDERLNGFAQEWADKLASSGRLGHRPSNPFGENIYYTTELDHLGNSAVDGWYEEIKKFRPGDSESGVWANTPTHHMTQLLWKTSLQLGVGVAKYPRGQFRYVVVANYNPPGNWRGQFKKNLPDITQQMIDSEMRT